MDLISKINHYFNTTAADLTTAKTKKFDLTGAAAKVSNRAKTAARRFFPNLTLPNSRVRTVTNGFKNQEATKKLAKAYLG